MSVSWYANAAATALTLAAPSASAAASSVMTRLVRARHALSDFWCESGTRQVSQPHICLCFSVMGLSCSGNR